VRPLCLTRPSAVASNVSSPWGIDLAIASRAVDINILCCLFEHQYHQRVLFQGLSRPSRRRKRCFAVFNQHRTRGSRHRLSTRRQIATTTIEMVGAGNIDDLTCHDWRWMICLVAAVVSFAKRSRSITLFDDVRGDGQSAAPAGSRPIHGPTRAEKRGPTCPKCKTPVIVRTATEGHAPPTDVFAVAYSLLATSFLK
jgi:hypothetical protein